MICKTCGYEAQKNFYICPSCGGDNIVAHDVNHEANQHKYYQNNNNASQYQTPFTSPNPNNESNNYNSDPTLNYQDISQSINEPVAPIRPIYIPEEMAPYFKGDIGSSFKATDNEIKISRFLNGGEFTFWPTVCSCVIAILIVAGAIYGIHLKPDIMNNQIGIFAFLFVLVCSGFTTQLGKFATIIVNPNGISIKTLLGKFHIPKEKVNYCECRAVTRVRFKGLGRYGRRRRIYRRYESAFEQVTYLDVFILLKEQNKFKIDTVDTGLCYRYSEPVNYLKDEFNRILDVQEKIF